MSTLEESYNRVAHEYVRHLYNELNHKPFDRKMLDWLAERAGKHGLICDMGCGPGQVAHHLSQQGATVCGIDLSAEMVKQASALNPPITFTQGNMLALTDVPNEAFGGIAAFYSIVHIAPEALAQVFREFYRVLKAGGTLLVTFHIGSEVRHLDEWWGESVSVDFIFFETAFVKVALQAAGLIILEVIERDPYPDVEVQTRRAYLFATKPETSE